MKPGDIVEVSKINRWGGHVPLDKWGILVKRTYMAYEQKFNKWDVLIDSKIISLTQRTLTIKKLSSENEGNYEA